ncbi:MAG: Aliphatic sulfonates import ATP-binding protein SsuB [Candidatus Dichloromethanomonas elyunquensis]|nr:MAG: Aliphatic sulfonates import ATP-binding protein SsuB [Candidatus Dichloromethanomonas elyunquensis]
MNRRLVEVGAIAKTFYSDWGKVEALKKISFCCSKSEFVSILGPSGCGKTTLLRIIAGLEEPSSGEVLFAGNEIKGPGPERAVVFQEPRLFPWLTVEENASLGISGKKRRSDLEKIVNRTLDLVGLTPFRKAYPHELSGGMAQRAAIARALAFEPEALLLDEPFSALDAQTRTRLQEELMDLWRKTEKTIILVTHDIEEALMLSQRILIMSPSPGTVKETVEVPISYPRRRDSSEFIHLKKYILGRIIS